ncbi:hypothetical protein AXY43_16015 [Clostridium sp. MF28]|uniref:hypothetical protein n=1 Tax=Clostridium TaxID=1485 RepID=UPI000CF9D47F|nr:MULTISPECIES: hypothetical protein [Clostridium]AVK49381.1 hypothetical protein AXY43_16015 [Clostridium sp. MF28]PSM58002.1 hypothetical protein C4L39_09295 [Clostridium diolis]
MNTLNVFKLYYIAWHQKNETREYSEFGCLKNNLNRYEAILQKSNIEDYISEYKYSMYLDLWEKVCTKKKEFFLAKIYKNISNIVEDASNILFYLSSQDISDYYGYTGADFNYNGENSEPSSTKIYKNLLLIARKLDLQLYNNLLKDIMRNVKLTKSNSHIIKNLWNTLDIDSYGKIHSTSQSYINLERFSHNSEIISEMTDFYNTLVYVDINKNK